VKSWIELLPAPFHRNPQVAVIMAPLSAGTRIITTRDKYELGVLELEDGKQLGLQVVHPQLATLGAHMDVFSLMKIPMAEPAYVGLVEDIPNSLLMEEERTPFLLLPDAMYRPYFHLRRYVAGITKAKGVIWG
jgi:hypothetical protein